MSYHFFEDYHHHHHPPVKGLDALVSLVMELTIDRLVVLVHHLERVRPVPGETLYSSSACSPVSPASPFPLFPFCLTVHILPVHESVAIGGSTIRKQEGDLTIQCHSNGGDICKTW